MKTRANIKGLVWGGLLVGTCLTVGCAKLSGGDHSVANAKSKPAAPEAHQVQTGTAAVSDPATLLSYKTGVARDKVEQILAIYQVNAKTADSGRDIYKIALFASEKTGVPTSQVGSVILGYKAMGGDETLTASSGAKTEQKKG